MVRCTYEEKKGKKGKRGKKRKKGKKEKKEKNGKKEKKGKKEYEMSTGNGGKERKDMMLVVLGIRSLRMGWSDVRNRK